MLAVVKMPHIEVNIKGFIAPEVLKVLRQEYGDYLKVKPEQDEDLEDIFETKDYKEFKKRVKPGDYVKVYRENLQLTQEDLGNKLGVSKTFICDVEKGRRNISIKKAKQLGEIFGISPARFI